MVSLTTGAVLYVRSSSLMLSCLLGMECVGVYGIKTYHSCSVVDPQICKDIESFKL